MSFIIKLHSALLSPFIFGAIVGRTHVIFYPESNIAVMFGITLIYSLPVYLILGIPSSLLIEKILERKYLIGSILTNFISSIHLIDAIRFGALLGAIASFIFFHLHFLLEVYSKK